MKMKKQKSNHCLKTLSDGGISASSDFADERIHKYLTFVLWCRSNDLVAEQDYSKRQFIVLRLIQTLQSEGMGYRKIAKKLNDAVHAASLFKFSKDKPAHPEKSGEANCR